MAFLGGGVRLKEFPVRPPLLSVTLQPPSVTLQPPSFTFQPPSLTLQPPMFTLPLLRVALPPPST